MHPRMAATALAILRKRDPDPTDVRLTGGRVVRVFNIAWGRDDGQDFDHITTNISPEPPGEHSIDFFLTSEIEAILDPETGSQIFP